MALTKIIGAGVGSLTENLVLGDSDKALFGAGSDLEIYHNGTHSFIADTGTGNLIIDTNAAEVDINSGGNAKFMGRFIKDAEVSLYHNGSVKIATASTGVNVTGGVGLGGTGAANILDDYEEGTWTPVFVSLNATFSYSVQLGSYVKVGNLVTLWFNITLNGTPGGTTSNTVFLGTLPFASKAIDASLYSGGHVGHYSNINVNTGTSVAYQNPSGSGTTVELKEIGDAQGENSVVASELTNGTFIRGSIFYRSA